MRSIIRIGYEDYLCKNETDAAALMKLMSRTLQIKRYLPCLGTNIIVEKSQPEIEMQLVRDNVKVVMEDAGGEVVSETKKKLKQIGQGQPTLMLMAGS